MRLRLRWWSLGKREWLVQIEREKIRCIFDVLTSSIVSAPNSFLHWIVSAHICFAFSISNFLAFKNLQGRLVNQLQITHSLHYDFQRISYKYSWLHIVEVKRITVTSNGNHQASRELSHQPTMLDETHQQPEAPQYHTHLQSKLISLDSFSFAFSLDYVSAY